jgi:DtxR family Mn-dependent transcriptional regulator
VHDEAERLEHHVSEVFEQRMERALNYPTFDPHGDPIPARDGSLPVMDDVALLGIDPGQSRKVSRVSDRDQDHLAQLTTAGIKPGALVTLVSNPLPDADVLLTVNGTDTEIPWTVAQGVRVDTVVG